MSKYLLNLYGRIFHIFPELTDSVKKVVQKHIGGLVKALSSTPQKLLSLIDTFPKGSDSLILRIIAVLANADPIPSSLIESVKGLYRKQDLDARFLIPILTALPKVAFVFFTIRMKYCKNWPRFSNYWMVQTVKR
jgi:symplekin